MKLIETWVQNVQREEIPADAKWFVQDRDDGLLKFSRFDKKPTGGNNSWYRGTVRAVTDSFGKFEVSTDAAETVVTREELMRAYDLVEQGYTLWFGGGCPVHPSDKVDHVCKSNYKGENTLARLLAWGDGMIIAYRLSQTADKAPDFVPFHDALAEVDASVPKVGDVIEVNTKLWGGGVDSINCNSRH